MQYVARPRCNTHRWFLLRSFLIMIHISLGSRDCFNPTVSRQNIHTYIHRYTELFICIIIVMIIIQ